MISVTKILLKYIVLTVVTLSISQTSGAFAADMSADEQAALCTAPVTDLQASAVQMVGAGEFANAVIDTELDANRGAYLPNFVNVANMSANVTGNSATNTFSGNNTIADGALNNMSGLSTIVQNTGNNVSIQTSTIVNLVMQ